jgi:hypothetical protein
MPSLFSISYPPNDANMRHDTSVIIAYQERAGNHDCHTVYQHAFKNSLFHTVQAFQGCAQIFFPGYQLLFQQDADSLQVRIEQEMPGAYCYSLLLK